MASRYLFCTRSLLQRLRKVQTLRLPLAFKGPAVLSSVDGTVYSRLNRARPFSTLQRDIIATADNRAVLKTSIRWKSKKSKKKAQEEEQEEDEEDDEEEEDAAQGDNEVSAFVSSMRIDSILKGGLNMSKTKAAEALYSGSIRVNGSRPHKKSQQVDVGDEVDYIIGFMPDNPSMMQVNRVTVLKIFADRLTDSGKFKVQLRRQRNLVIEKYDDYEES